MNKIYINKNYKDTSKFIDLKKIQFNDEFSKIYQILRFKD